MADCLGKSCLFGLSWAFVKFCVCQSFPFGIEGRMWVVPDFCLSVYFPSYLILSEIQGNITGP